MGLVLQQLTPEGHMEHVVFATVCFSTDLENDFSHSGGQREIQREETFPHCFSLPRNHMSAEARFTTWQSFVGTSVSCTLRDQSVFFGELFVIDPLTSSITLLIEPKVAAGSAASPNSKDSYAIFFPAHSIIRLESSA